MLSRVADSLYWMSRYLERAEHTARLVDVQLNLMLESSANKSTDQRWQRVLNALNIQVPESSLDVPYEFATVMTFDVNSSSSVASAVYGARENARQVRDLVTTEMWQELNRLYLSVKESRANGRLGAQPHDFFQTVKDRVQMFQGITDSTMSHNEGWYFIQLGRSIERAGSLAALLDVHFGAFANYNMVTMDDYFEWLGLLKSCTAFEPYTKVYSPELDPACIAEFLLLNEDFPHSVRFCADQVQDALKAVATYTGTSLGGRVHRLAGRLRATLNYDEISDIMSDDLHHYLHQIQRQFSDIHTATYETYIDYPIESVFNIS